MVDREVIAATEAQWFQARKRMKQLGTQSALLAVSLITLISLPASYLADEMFSGVPAAVMTAAVMLGSAIPLTGLVWFRMDRQQRLANRLMKTLRAQLKNAIDEVENESVRREAQVRRQEFESRLARDGDGRGRSRSRRRHRAIHGRHASGRCGRVAAGRQQPCPPASHGQHIADRRGPRLRGQLTRSLPRGTPFAGAALREQRRTGRVPEAARPPARHRVSRLRSGLHHGSHRRGAPCRRRRGEPFAPSQVSELGTLANQAGARIGLLRVMADTQLQAATDSLTGLLNRRSFERKLTRSASERADRRAGNGRPRSLQDAQ